MRLHVGVLGAEELLGAVAGQVLDHVGELAAAVVAPSGIALGVLVGEHRAHGLQHGLADEVLRGDQLQAFVLAALFMGDGLGNLGIHFAEGARHACRSSGRLLFGEYLLYTEGHRSRVLKF